MTPEQIAHVQNTFAILNNLDSIVPAVQAMGVRHKGYGVTPEQYNFVADALLETLAHFLGDQFTPEVKEAWAAAYGILATTMIDAAEAA